MPAGRPRKRPRNLTGLRNQKPQDVPVPVAQPTPIDQSAGLKKAPNDSQGADVQDEPKEPDAELLGKTMGQKEVEGEEKPEADNDNEEVAVLDDWNDEELHENMIRLAANEGNNPQDEDWVPYKLQKSKKRTRTERPKEYKKGPDVMSKSERTQSRYRYATQGQTSLTAFGFKKVG